MLGNGSCTTLATPALAKVTSLRCTARSFCQSMITVLVCIIPLTQTQASALERLQAQALKTIYGYKHSYRALLEMTGLQTLQARRDARCLKFARKLLTNDRFAHWFPLHPVERVTRNPLIYKELQARTKRLYDSPIYHMRRLLNGRRG